MATITLPASLQKLALDNKQVKTDEGELLAALKNLELRYPNLSGKLLTIKSLPQRYIRVFLNGQDVTDRLNGNQVKITESDHIKILMALAGG